MRIVGLIVIALAIVVGLGFNLSSTFDIPSTLIVLGGTLALLLFGGSSIRAMFTSIFSSGVPPEQLRAGARDWKLAGVYSLATGAIGSLLGLVIMLKNMDDPAALGPGMAIDSLTILYGIVLSFAICLPLQKLLEDRMQQGTDSV